MNLLNFTKKIYKQSKVKKYKINLMSPTLCVYT